MKRSFWLVFGAFTQLLFVVTICRLFPFLRGGDHFHGLLSPEPGASAAWFVTDGLLAVQFAVIHSILLLPTVRRALSRWMPQALYGSIFCVATCVCLLLVMETWQPSAAAVWNLQGSAARVVDLAFLTSWGALIYSLWLTGLGYQTGLTPWWAWARGRAVPRRGFEPKGAYRLLRHPVYLSFLGLIWFNPLMTHDRMILALAWSTHIFVGSYLKDRRLVHYIGETYREYQRHVPGYPFIPYGPLGKLRAQKAKV
jgi:protein-S-isoprenylcysteine O-methyltransferase Ste14